MEFNLGDIVWAKLKGFPHWPSEIIVLDNLKCQVRFLGDNDKTAELKLAQIKPYRTNFKIHCHKLTRKSFVSAVEESFQYGDLKDLGNFYEQEKLRCKKKNSTPNSSQSSEHEIVETKEVVELMEVIEDPILIKKLHQQIQITEMSTQDLKLFRKSCLVLSKVVADQNADIATDLINSMILTFCKLVFYACDGDIFEFKLKIQLYIKAIKRQLLTLETLTIITFKQNIESLNELNVKVYQLIQERQNQRVCQTYFEIRSLTYQLFLV